MTVAKVLVVGGGITGTVAAIALAQRGVKVSLVEKSSKYFGVGHGITVQGNALKALSEIGVAEQVMAKGVTFDSVSVRHADGHELVKVQTAKTGGQELPSTMGTLRSDLQTILVNKLHDSGVDLRLGMSLTGFTEEPGAIEAQLSDGSTEKFDLIIGADGIRSYTRTLLGITDTPAPSGMGIWRVVTGRTPAMNTAAVYYHGPAYKAGYAPISETQCYAYILTDPAGGQEDGWTPAETVRKLAEDYHGTWDYLRDSITEATFVNFSPIEWLMVEGPWHKGRIIMIGDAVHACPPLIAQGAAMCTEDAVLLADYATRDGDLESNLTAFEERRKPRVKLVLDASLQMADWEIHPDADGDPAGLMADTLSRLAAPA
ncbi:FAD-dependent monooxygenase [Paenarthrobacter sp. TYUT067]|uniref:FAD-dependent monooxygenase n=1 Tax=Paenarthrobacter sp. TYUT067 TaxID=2926245 RepID=UPI002030042A|nr:FAD-dependent monooxygenase [Paenarthrobacter sp. TYUT067]MCM0616840.1 FAD-dependent monooxygenase [Paenarthrobacter sp. TYUT067]